MLWTDHIGDREAGVYAWLISLMVSTDGATHGPELPWGRGKGVMAVELAKRQPGRMGWQLFCGLGWPFRRSRFVLLSSKEAEGGGGGLVTVLARC